MHNATERDLNCGMENADIVDRLKRVRKDLELSQEEMAELVGTKFRTWQRYEAGDSLPKLQYLSVIAQKGYDLNWLLTGVGSMKTSIKAEMPDVPLDGALLEEAIEFVKEIEEERRIILANHNFAKAVMAYYGYVLECREKDEKADKTAMKHAMKAAM